MAFETTPLYEGPTTQGPTLRIAATHLQVKTFRIDAGAPLLVKGTWLGRIAIGGQWVPYDAGSILGAEVVSGVVWPDDIQLSASEEVMANVLMAGKVHMDDTTDPTAAQSPPVTNLAAIADGARAVDIHVEGAPIYGAI